MHKNRFQFSGFTLIELLVAAMIIAILVAISVPMYLEHSEKAMGAKALENLYNIRTAEMIYMTENAAFSGVRNTLNSYSPIGPDDTDWNYTIVSNTADTFTATATRQSPNNAIYNGRQITIDQDSTIVGLPYP